MTPNIDLIATNFSDMFVYIVASIFFIILAGFPLLIVYIITQRIKLTNKQQNLVIFTKDEQTKLAEETRTFDKKYDVVYVDLRKLISPIGLHYYMIYILRRFVFIMVAFYL